MVRVPVFKEPMVLECEEQAARLVKPGTHCWRESDLCLRYECSRKFRVVREERANELRYCTVAPSRSPGCHVRASWTKKRMYTFPRRNDRMREESSPHSPPIVPTNTGPMKPQDVYLDRMIEQRRAYTVRIEMTRKEC